MTAHRNLPPALRSGFWLVGCGAMGGALLTRWLEAGLPADAVTVIDPSPKGLPAGFHSRVAGSAAEAEGRPTTLVLGVKPQMLAAVAPGLRPLLAPDTLVLSMLAGARVATLRGLFGGAPVMRIMPNTPARIGRGVSGLYGEGLDEAQEEAVSWLADAVGTHVRLAAEDQFDALTAVSGSGPAYLFRFLEAFTAAGEAAGLPHEMALALARDTVAGAAELAVRSGRDPGELRVEVTSPNGTTAAGVQALDGAGELTALMEATVAAAAARNRAMAEAVEAAART